MSKNMKSKNSTNLNAEEHAVEPAFEDKVLAFWKKNRRHLVLIFIFAVLVALGFQGLSYYRAYKVVQLQEEYRDAKEKGESLAFAKSNPREPLSGVVFLAEADRLYGLGEYKEAIEYYSLVKQSLDKTDLAGRERLGLALCHLLIGDKAKGYEVLDALKQDSKALGVVRSEAAYQLALLDLKDGNITKAKEHLNFIPTLSNTGIWGQKAIILKDSTPELS